MTRQARRRILRHGTLAVGSSLAIMALDRILTPEDPVVRLSLATAYTGAALLAATLVVGPLNVLRGRPNPVSTYLRRDLGIWAGLIALTHVGVGLQVHLRGKMWQYFVFPPEWNRFFPLRYDPFGGANWAGLGAGLLILLLLVLSNDASLRRLGTRRWKGLQRWNYAVFVLVGLHGVTYQLLENRWWGGVAALGLMVLTVATAQVWGLRTRRTRSEGKQGPD